MSFNTYWWYTEFQAQNDWRWRIEICPRNASLVDAIANGTPFVANWRELPRDFLVSIDDLETSYTDNFPLGFPAALRAVAVVDAAEFARVYDQGDANTLTHANGALYLPHPSGATGSMNVMAGHIWVFRTDRGNSALDLTEPECVWWVGMQSQDTTVEIEQELLRLDNGTIEIGEKPVKIEILDAVYEILRQFDIYAFGEYLLYKHRRTGPSPAKRVKRIYEAVQKRDGEAYVRTVTEDWGEHHAALLSRYEISQAMADVLIHYALESGISQHVQVGGWAGGIFDNYASFFYKQRYDMKGAFTDTALDGDDLYLIAAVYDGAASDTPIYGLFVKQTIECAGIQGAGFDGESLWDMLVNTSPGFGQKSRILHRDGFIGVEHAAMFDPPIDEENRELDILSEALTNPIYTTSAYSFRSFGFNIEVDPADKNIGEFRAMVRSTGSNTSEDVDRRMQLHNLPRIRQYDIKDNPDCPTGLSWQDFVNIRPQLRQMPYTLRRWYYIDSVDDVSGELPDGKIAIRVSDYTTWQASDPALFINAGDYTGEFEAGVFDGDMESWFRDMQKKGGLPGQLAAMMGYEFDETGYMSGNPTNMYSLKVSVGIDVADAVRIGDVYEVAVPIRTYLDGFGVLVSCKTDILTGVSECEFLVRAPR